MLRRRRKTQKIRTKIQRRQEKYDGKTKQKDGRVKYAKGKGIKTERSEENNNRQSGGKETQTI